MTDASSAADAGREDTDAVLLPAGVDPALLTERDLLYGIWRDLHFLRNVVIWLLLLYVAGIVVTAAVAL